MLDGPLSHQTKPGKQAETTILTLTGPLTLQNLFGFQDAFRALASPVLIVDLSSVEYIDSAGLGLLVNGHTSAQDHNRRFLLAGVNSRVAALIETTHLDRVLSIFPSVAAAEASL